MKIFIVWAIGVLIILALPFLTRSLYEIYLEDEMGKELLVSAAPIWPILLTVMIWVVIANLLTFDILEAKYKNLLAKRWKA